MSLPEPRATKPRRTKASRGTAPSVYPFSAIVGQEDMKLALLLTVLDSHIGGVVVMGHRGTAKSTAVRALADLLPSKVRVKDCPFNCDPNRVRDLCRECHQRRGKGKRLPRETFAVPVVDLPLGATEDRVCGSLDIEQALNRGAKVFQPGLLAQAHQGFLYIDEVNLLEDFLVDLLLDAAASGRNQVEREGLSVSHAARFVLVGSGNPEEGELRPQLLDRFGLFVEVRTLDDLDERIEIVRRRQGFEQDPAGFCAQAELLQEELRHKLKAALSRISRVGVDPGLLRGMAELCLRLEVAGHRGELTLYRASRALAAWQGREVVLPEDIRRVAVMSLRHRLQKDPLEPLESAARIEQALDRVFPLEPKDAQAAGG
ncbi:MAG: magnesium chelatase ATPase subunit I [Acidobacteriota bacterium]|nr:magnesium chelatase ATPase subunit I [Acidobacteriota bacterium]